MKYEIRLVSGGTPSKERDDYWGGDVPWASAKDLKTEELLDTADHVSEVALREGAADLVPADTVLTVVRGMILAHTLPVAVAKRPMAINQDLKGITPRRSLTHHYLAWLLRGLSREVLSRVDEAGHGTKALRVNDWLGMIIPVPPREEQLAIVGFIKEHCVRLDTLIAKQERLIELLEEKKQAVISHAVTKGLHPTARVKDSGMQWIGVTPTHWQIKRLKFISPFITVGIVVNPSTFVADEGVPFIYGGDISEGCIDAIGGRKISPADSDLNAKTRLSQGDLLMVRVGAPGVTSVVPKECEGGNCASVMLVRKGAYDSNWLCYAMNSPMVREQVRLVQYGAAQEQFNIRDAINFWIATPPPAEQAEIAAFLSEKTQNVRALMDEARRSIDLMREHRSALIFAAITGKIDVRGDVAVTMRDAPTLTPV